jgi:hypothetical protein
MWALGEKFERWTCLEFKMHLNFSDVKSRHLLFEVVWNYRLMLVIIDSSVYLIPAGLSSHRNL